VIAYWFMQFVCPSSTALPLCFGF